MGIWGEGNRAGCQGSDGGGPVQLCRETFVGWQLGADDFWAGPETTHYAAGGVSFLERWGDLSRLKHCGWISGVRAQGNRREVIEVAQMVCRLFGGYLR
jgi:hypothetical protein